MRISELGPEELARRLALIGAKEMSQKYAYAVMDGNEACDTDRFPESCHKTKEAAIREAKRLNSKDANDCYYVRFWDARRWARARAGPCHDEGTDGWWPEGRVR